MITIGLDLSLTKSGVTIVKEDGNVLFSGVVKSKPSGKSYLSETQRLITIKETIIQQIKKVLPKDKEILVSIEGFAFGVRNSRSLTQLAGLSYLIRADLIALSIPFIIIQATTLKKFITGSGKGDKDMIMMKIYKNYGFEALGNDQADAYGLAACALALKEKPLIPLGKKQQEVINLLKKQV